MNKTLLFQLFRFGIVGILAAIVHFSVVIFLVEAGFLKPLVANIIAFMIAFQVSYVGHRYWTFRGTIVRHHEAFPKLLLVNSLGLMANESLFYLLMTVFHLTYPLALFLVLMILPLLTFIVNKSWVFE